MMRKYKFRGKNIWTGDTVYGDLLHDNDDVLIKPFGKTPCVQVDPDSVSQFLGFDCKGREVYSNDKLIDDFDIVEDAEIALQMWDLGDTFKNYCLWE